MKYEEKFRSFIEMLAEAKRTGAETVIIQRPKILGDTYDEMVESLNRLAGANLTLTLLPSEAR